LTKHIKSCGLPDDVWLTKWFISLFTGYFSTYYVARFLDFIFCNDIFVMPILVVTMVMSLKKKIMGQDMDSLNEML
jgi:Rab-GTPase-TBC domain